MTAYRQIINYGIAQELLVSCRKSRQKAVTKQIQDKLLAFYGLLPNTQLVLLQAKQAPHRHHTAYLIIHQIQVHRWELREVIDRECAVCRRSDLDYLEAL